MTRFSDVTRVAVVLLFSTVLKSRCHTHIDMQILSCGHLSDIALGMCPEGPGIEFFNPIDLFNNY